MEVFVTENYVLQKREIQPPGEVCISENIKRGIICGLTKI